MGHINVIDIEILTQWTKIQNDLYMCILHMLEYTFSLAGYCRPNLLVHCAVDSSKFKLNCFGIFRFLFYFTAAGVKCRVAALKRLPILHHRADYLGTLSNSRYFENRIPFRPVLGGECKLHGCI